MNKPIENIGSVQEVRHELIRPKLRAGRVCGGEVKKCYVQKMYVSVG